MGGIGTIAYFAWPKKETKTENQEQTTEKKVQNLQNKISQIKQTLNKPKNSGKKVKYSVQLAEIENKLDNLPQQNIQEQEKIINKVENEVKEIGQDLGIKEEPEERKPDKKPDNPPPEPNPNEPNSPPIPPSNNLESERKRLINELENSCEEKEPKLPKKAVQKFVKQINDASLTELPKIFQQGQEFIKTKRAEKEWWNLFRQEAEARATKRGVNIEEIARKRDATKLLEEIKRRPSTFSSKAKLTESEVKGVSTNNFGYFVASLVKLSKQKLKKSKFPEFLFVCENIDDKLIGHKFYEDDWEIVKEDYFQEIIDKLKVEFSQLNADIQHSMEDIQHITSKFSGFKEEQFIEWGIEYCLFYVKASLLRDMWKNIHLLAKKPCVLKSWQTDKYGIEFKVKTSSTGLVTTITPSYLEDDKTVDYSQMTDEQLKAEIKTPHSFYDEHEI